jgi:hypothetical protein
MYRNLSAVLATLALGVSTASATTATTQPSGQSLEQRVLAAQKTIGAVINAQDPAAQPGSEKLAQYYGGYGGGYSPWSQWSQWSQWHQYQQHRYYYGY